MARIKVDTITDRNNSGSPTLTNGATLPSETSLSVGGNINFVGITTIGLLNADNATVVGVITATQFVGDGALLQGVPSVSSSKSIALKIVLDPLPFRS